MDIAANVDWVRKTVAEAARRAGRDPGRITIVAATKFVPAESIRLAYDAGLRAFGENRLQEAQSKMVALGRLPDIQWHFIGRVQRRKLKAVTGRFALIHSLESVEHAEIMNRWAQEQGVRQPVLLEVNIGDEPTKGGFAPSRLWEALPALGACTHVSIRGLMTVPPPVDNPEDARPYFRELRRMAEAVARSSPPSITMQELSMGMSGDYPVAIEEGATIVRIGTAIFGPRTAT